MSAFLSSPDTLSALVTYWAAKASAPGSYSTPADSLLRAYQFSCRARSGSSGDLVIDDEVATLIGANNPAKAADTAYRILLLENQRSLAARYPDDDGYRAAGARYTYRRLPIVQFWLSTQATGQLVGLLGKYSKFAGVADKQRAEVSSPSPAADTPPAPAQDEAPAVPAKPVLKARKVKAAEVAADGAPARSAKAPRSTESKPGKPGAPRPAGRDDAPF